jgi:GT2 family glycosyltransferase
VRRTALERVNGFDEGFFMYCEDMDLCRRLREAGYGLWYVPEAEVEHVGGASAPRTDLLPVLARSRIRYAAKHRGRWGTLSERAGVALGAATHLVLGRGGVAARRGHARAIGAALSSIPADARPTQSAA